MKIDEVTTKQLAEEFIELPKYLYKHDPNYISPLDKDIHSVFDPKLNNFHSHGICKRWIAKDDSGKPAGRIAAFINFKKNKDPQNIIGGIGFFESIQEESVAFALFNTAKEWLRVKGAKAMEGPINFGENDKYWGLLVEGFVPPSMGMNYNPPYYQGFFEKYGFVKEYDQFTNVIYTERGFPERFSKIAERVVNKPEYRFIHFEKARFKKFARDFQEIYNDAWSEFDDFTPIELETINESFREMKLIVNERIIWFAYHNDEPVAFVIAVPDINVFLKPFKGKLNLWNKMRFLWEIKTSKNHRIRFIVMGCKRKFQNRGVESGMILQLQRETLPQKIIKEAELAWVGDWNTKMIAIHEATGAVREKVHRTYRLKWDG